MKKLTHVCIISRDIKRLTAFYQDILEIEPQVYDDAYAEFSTGGCILSLFSLSGHEGVAPGSMQPASNRSVELEFEVEDVDTEYARLQQLETEWVLSPTTLPWGNRSIYFRDPEGNLINFYSRVYEA